MKFIKKTKIKLPEKKEIGKILKICRSKTVFILELKHYHFILQMIFL